MIELHSFSSFEEISLASKFALIVIGILSTLVTVPHLAWGFCMVNYLIRVVIVNRFKK